MLDQNVPNPFAKNPSFHTHKVFASIGLILIVLIVVVGGIWYFVQSAEDKAGTVDDNTIIKTSTSSAKKSTESAKKDETADWSLYTNSTYKFSFKYDKQKHGSVGEADPTKLINSPPGELLIVGLDNGTLNLVVSSKDKQSVLDSLITSMKPECALFKEIKQTEINGEIADELICKNTSTKERFSNWFFSKFGYTYWMNGEEQIVNTFKFL